MKIGLRCLAGDLRQHNVSRHEDHIEPQENQHRRDTIMTANIFRDASARTPPHNTYAQTS